MPTAIRHDKNGFYSLSSQGDQKIVRRFSQCRTKSQLRQLLRRELHLLPRDLVSLAVGKNTWDGTQWVDDEAPKMK